LTAAEPVMQQMPTAVGQLLIARDLWLGPASELVIVGGSKEAANQGVIAAVQKSFLPRSVVAYRSGSKPGANPTGTLDPLFVGRLEADHQPRLYICQNFTCQAPLRGVDNIKAALAQL